MSREHCGKKLLVTTEEISHKTYFKFQILEPPGLQILKSHFLIFSPDVVVDESNMQSDR